MPAKELEAIAVETRPLLNVSDFEMVNEPAKELEPVKVDLKVLAGIKDLAISSEPAKDDEPVPRTVSLPKFSKALTTKPLEILREPANEFEVVFEELSVPAKVNELVIPTLPAKDEEPVPVKAPTGTDKPLDSLKLPAKELEPVKLEFNVLDRINDLEIPKLPAKELDEVAEPCENCLATDKPPANDEEPVPKPV